MNTFYIKNVFFLITVLYSSFLFSSNFSPQEKSKAEFNLDSLALASVFTNNMVLQRDMLVPIWGTAKPASTIQVEFANQKKQIQTKADGTWMLRLDSLKASTVSRSLKITSTLTNDIEYLEFQDVLVGEVWICSGQSNMQMDFENIPDIKVLEKTAQNIRTFNVPRTVAFTKQAYCKGAWVIENPSSAVAFSFAYFLEKEAQVPIGIILNPWGSSSIEAWMPLEMTATVPHFKQIMADFDANTEFHKKIQTILEKPDPRATKDDIFLRRQPNILYNAMMHPLIPFACRGIVWYQGERNTQSIYGDTKDPWWTQNSGMLAYGETLKQWILQYRKDWGRDDFEFLIVMLPSNANDFVDQAENPDMPSWAWMRESQLQALDLSYTAVVNTIDLGDVKDYHPKDKLPIGKRLALLAERNTLSRNVVAEGPILKEVKKYGRKLKLSYSNASGLKTTDNQPPKGFWVSNNEGEWHEAKARITGSKVVVMSPEVKNPLYVRYAFAGMPSVNLVNEENLPAYPFRTDQFKPKN